MSESKDNMPANNLVLFHVLAGKDRDRKTAWKSPVIISHSNRLKLLSVRAF